MSKADESAITIRDVETIADIRQVERLQKDVWGVPDLDVVPLSQLTAAKAAGGVLIGAFDDDRMVGFAYGFVGRERGVTVHHSHMLAVASGYRSRDLGFRLKCEQRSRVLAQGIEVMTWTFDPLRSLNANFNFGKLGVVADRYFVDFYGAEAESFLHQSGTDRLWVSWHLSSDRVKQTLTGVAIREPPLELPVLVAACETGPPLVGSQSKAFASDRFAIEIPRDIGEIESGNPQLARSWRTATRNAFTAAIDAGFIVEDFITGRSGSIAGLYILGRDIG